MCAAEGHSWSRSPAQPDGCRAVQSSQQMLRLAATNGPHSGWARGMCRQMGCPGIVEQQQTSSTAQHPC